MTCEAIERELVGYLFVTLDAETRAKVEEHLVGCAACVRALVELKRALEDGDDAPAPSPTARRRLRASVARELGLGAKPRRFWERPVAFAVAASAVLAAGAATRALTAPATAPHGIAAVDLEPK